MKKIYLSISVMFVLGVSYGQHNLSRSFIPVAKQEHHSLLYVKQDGNLSNKIRTKKEDDIIVKVVGDTLWAEHFKTGIPVGWVIDTSKLSGKKAYWEWSNADKVLGGQHEEPVRIKSDAVDDTDVGYLVFNADKFNKPDGKNKWNSSITSPTINLKTTQDVTVNFQYYARVYEEIVKYPPTTLTKLELGYSKDDGVTWTYKDVRGGLAGLYTNVYSKNAVRSVVNIGEITETTKLKIKFKWSEGSSYFWQVDNIILSKTPNVDLVLDTAYFNAYLNNYAKYYYTKMPIKQAKQTSLEFGAKGVNKGAVAQTNSRFEFVVTNGSTINDTIKSEKKVSVVPESTYRDKAVTKFSFKEKGNYSISFIAKSDDIMNDAIINNNTFKYNLEITDTVYSRYKKVKDGDFVSVSTVEKRIGDIGTRGTWFAIYDDAIATSGTVRIVNDAPAVSRGSKIKLSLYKKGNNGRFELTPVASSNVYEVKTRDLFLEVRLKFTTPYQVKAGESYMLAINPIEGKCFYVENYKQYTTLHSYIIHVIRGVEEWGFVAGHIPAFDLNFKSNLTGIGETVLNKKIFAYPNPATDELNVIMRDLTTGNYNVTLSNLLGQIVETRKIRVSSANHNFKIDLSGKEKGVYFLNTENENKQRVVLKVIVR